MPQGGGTGPRGAWLLDVLVNIRPAFMPETGRIGMPKDREGHTIPYPTRALIPDCLWWRVPNTPQVKPRHVVEWEGRERGRSEDNKIDKTRVQLPAGEKLPDAGKFFGADFPSRRGEACELFALPLYFYYSVFLLSSPTMLLLKL
ncbi:hypothetical protein NKR23_g6815 [Pleurostoma richardsiae]|uniref:Uncharacterized protein n=1 Tax=Pleurostoma richardsiae TaxID=41990 RepID=A0AA38RUX7_9PEZI|nr:hypothetical protein NKR23_g6815 [Pleurostoma richardsiae]